MGKRASKVTESLKSLFSLRVMEFASAIHNYGVEKLYSDLKSNGKITTTYPLGTFRTDFKRMKAGANGFLNEPALISAICELLHFPASALFGGPVSSDVENREMIKAAINDRQNFF